MDLYRLLPTIIQIKDKIASVPNESVNSRNDFPSTGAVLRGNEDKCVLYDLRESAELLQYSTKYRLRYAYKIGGVWSSWIHRDISWVPGDEYVLKFPIYNSISTITASQLKFELYRYSTDKTIGYYHFSNLLVSADTTVSTGAWYLQTLGVLERFLDCLSVQISDDIAEIENIVNLASAEDVNDEYLTALTYILGTCIQGDEYLHRFLAMNLVWMYKQSGTLHGVYTHLKRTTGEYRIVELYKDGTISIPHKTATEYTNYSETETSTYKYRSSKIAISGPCSQYCQTSRQAGYTQRLRYGAAKALVDRIPYMPAHVQPKPELYRVVQIERAAAIRETFLGTVGYPVVEDAREPVDTIALGSLCISACQGICQNLCESDCAVASCQTDCAVMNCQTDCAVVACQSDCASFACQSDCAAVTCQSDCVTGCQSECTSGFCQASCQDTCQSSCEDTCQGSCQGTCITGCEGTCEPVTESSCQRDCEAGGCTAGCTGDCIGFCMTGCEQSCVGSCEGTCTANYEGSCNTSCTITSRESCDSSNCQSDCTSGCQSDCTSGCQTDCAVVACQSNCTAGGCQNDCTMDCQTDCTSAACQSDCEYGGCQSNCTGGCETGCVGGCQNDCTGGCTGACTAGCTGACTAGCTGDCTTGCTGPCTAGCVAGCTGSMPPPPESSHDLESSHPPSSHHPSSGTTSADSSCITFSEMNISGSFCCTTGYRTTDRVYGEGGGSISIHSCYEFSPFNCYDCGPTGTITLEQTKAYYDSVPDVWEVECGFPCAGFCMYAKAGYGVSYSLWYNFCGYTGYMDVALVADLCSILT